MICDRSSEAQSLQVCGAQPYLGASGPEICVVITQANPPIAPIYFRVPAGPAPFVVGLTAGEYAIMGMAINYVPGPIGMGIGMGGMVARTSPGNATLTITALGGLGTPITDGAGTITLGGAATGTSRTIVGGAAGWLNPSIPGDVQLTGFNVPAEATTLGAGPFMDAPPPQSITTGGDTVAAYMSVSFHSNDVGTAIAIPAGVGIAPAGATPPAVNAVGGWPHFECYDIDEHYPSEEYREVMLSDQFDKSDKKIGKITRLCTPVDKNEEGIPDAELHLVCYEILKGHDPNQAVETTNQFGDATMNVRVAQELCVPSRKEHISEKQQKEQQQQREQEPQE